MKALLTRKTIVIATISVLIAIVAIVSVNVFSSSGPVTGLANVITQPFRSLALTVARTFESIYSSIYRYDALLRDYETLQRDRADLDMAQREAEDLRRENNELREVLGFRERHAGYDVEEAVVISWSSNNFTSSFTISRGHSNSERPIAVGNSVITHYGVLVGQITEVGPTTSTVVSVIDTTFSAGAYVGDGEGSATIKGDFSLMTSGLIMIDHIGDDLIVLPGDLVVTSGAGAVFPVGLVVGEVLEVHRHSTGVGRYATVSPMRAIDTSITNVYIITSFDIMG